MKRLAIGVALASVTLVGVSAPAFASKGHDKPAVCHPKAGGWVLINPAQASSHIDEATGQPKHEHDGRVDVYAVNGACPVISTPTPTTTGGTPSPTTTTSSTPSTAPTTTTTSSSPSPSQTSSTSTGSASPSPVSPRRSVPSSTVAPPELAFTGINGSLAVLGGVLLAGGGFILAGRKGMH